MESSEAQSIWDRLNSAIVASNPRLHGIYPPPTPLMMPTRRYDERIGQEPKIKKGPALTTLAAVKTHLRSQLQCCWCGLYLQPGEPIHMDASRPIVCQDCPIEYPMNCRMRTLEVICRAAFREGQTFADFRREARTAAQCPVCLDCPEDQPRVLCLNGHSTCLGCQKSLVQPSCPVCREKYQWGAALVDEISPSLIIRLKSD